MQNNLFLFVVWSKARKTEDEIRAELARHFKVLAETEIFWPRRDFTRKLFEFYGFGSRFLWWNKGRKCGRGPFKVMVFQVDDPQYRTTVNPFGRKVLVERRIDDLKRTLRRQTGHHNILHGSLNAEETEREAQALFGRPLAAWLEERRAWRIPPLVALEELSASGRMTRLGVGSRRTCLAIPETDLCLKGYRNEAEIALGKHVDGGDFKPLAPSVVREIRDHRFSDERNTSCQEWRYYNMLKARLPAELFAAFPEVLERVALPSRGWCLIENVVRNADGTPVEKFHSAYAKAKDDGLRAEMLRRLQELEDGLVKHAVRFYDSQNVMVQRISDADFRLRIVDFEPASRTWISPDAWCTAFVRMKVRRRFARYRRMHGW